MLSEKKLEKESKIKKTLLVFLGVVILINLYILYTPIKRVYLVSNHAYPEAKIWEFLAMSVREYGSLLAHYTPLTERNKVIKKFIELDESLLDKAHQSIPKDDLQRHLKIYNKVVWYYMSNVPNAKLWKHGFYDISDTKLMLTEIEKQLQLIMKYDSKSRFYQFERFKAWQNLSYIYIMSAIAFWLENEKKFNYKEYISDTTKLDLFIKFYDFNERISIEYKNMYPQLYNQYTINHIEAYRKHNFLVYVMPYLLNNSEKYIKNEFCDIAGNKYLKDYIETRNEILLLKKDKNRGQKWIENLLSHYRDKLINRKCKNIKLIKGEYYEYNK